jgi:uncharacterized protein (UPF0548 family)
MPASDETDGQKQILIEKCRDDLNRIAVVSGEFKRIPMFLFRPPNDLALAAFRLKQSRLPFSYPHVGCTQLESRPAGYDADRTRVKLGTGLDVFDAACDAIRNWRQFPASWTRIDPPDATIAVGTVVAMVARVYGLVTVNACRIVNVIDEPNRFGFTYGTLPGHVEQGEERFLVERTSDGDVWYTILAYSRPRHWLARVGYPLARIQQARFRRDSGRSMQEAVRQLTLCRN